MIINLENESVKELQIYLTTIEEGLITKKISNFYNEQSVKLFSECCFIFSKDECSRNVKEKELFALNFAKVLTEFIDMLTKEKAYTKAKETIYTNYLELTLESLQSINKNHGKLEFFPYLDSNNKLWQYTYNHENGKYSSQNVNTKTFKDHLM